jgi:peroxiredoxin Q/BCP
MSEPKPLPTIGEAAPEVDAQVTGDGPFLLSAQRGKWVVVYFYPRANTPG